MTEAGFAFAGTAPLAVAPLLPTSSHVNLGTHSTSRLMSSISFHAESSSRLIPLAPYVFRLIRNTWSHADPLKRTPLMASNGLPPVASQGHCSIALAISLFDSSSRRRGRLFGGSTNGRRPAAAPARPAPATGPPPPPPKAMSR